MAATLILFMSDNGFFYGEHGLSLERRLPYEESIRTPLIVRFPALARPGSRVEELVASVDIAPTVLEIAGTPIGEQIQGRSMVPLLQGGATDWRRSVLIEFYSYENPFPWLVDLDYRALRTERYKYIHWITYPAEAELYDLRNDPFETRNLIHEPELAGLITDLRAELAKRVLEALGLTR
jgi:N-acetylglucosamine-6-sulfatase